MPMALSKQRRRRLRVHIWQWTLLCDPKEKRQEELASENLGAFVLYTQFSDLCFLKSCPFLRRNTDKESLEKCIQSRGKGKPYMQAVDNDCPLMNLVWLVGWLVLVFQNRVSLCNSPGCPGTCSVDQAGHPCPTNLII